MKLDLKDSDLFGHQIKNTRRAKLLHLKHFEEFLNFYLFCEISFNFLKMSIFYGFLNKFKKKYEINLFFLKAGGFNVQLWPCAGDWRYCLKAGDSSVKRETWHPYLNFTYDFNFNICFNGQNMLNSIQSKTWESIQISIKFD